MPTIAHGRYADLLRGHLGIDANQPAASELNPDIHSTFDLRGREEDGYLALERKCFSFVDRNAVAGQLSSVRVSNPVGSGVLAVVTHVHARTVPGASDLALFTAAIQTDGDSSTTIGFADLRNGVGTAGGRALSALGGFRVSGALIAFFIPQFSTTGFTYHMLQLSDLIIPPGLDFVFSHTVANQPLQLWLRHYERPFLATELRSTP